MTSPILATKLYIPSLRSNIVFRADLIEQLNAGLNQNQGFGRKLTLISAPAGFGKTTLVSEWVTSCEQSNAWLSLDEGDNDPLRFLTYLVAALKTISDGFGERVLGLVQAPQPPPPEAILTTLLNEITLIPKKFILILDDYHLIDAQPIDLALAFLIKHLPPKMHLVIVTREDPQLPLARLRSQGQLTELRANDLRFTQTEVVEFLNQVMDLNLSVDDILALESRTEGWIAGLQLAGLALQGANTNPNQQNSTSFIQSFTGSHHFVLDYLVEEVLHQQPENLQSFLLSTSILNRMCGPLCDAVCTDENGSISSSGKETLEYLRQSNLFIVPLDNERRWYRYHHLFADLLRQRLQQHVTTTTENGVNSVSEYHIRASIWFEENNLETEAFQHAIAANDIDRAARLVEGDWMPLHFRGAVIPVLTWLSSLPKSVLDARPLLWVMYASALSMTGQLTGVEEKLQLAEAAVAKISKDGSELDRISRNTIGHVAAIRALLAATQYQVETIITESQRALEYLHPDNLAVRTATIWKMGIAYHLQGNRNAAIQAYSEAIAIGRRSGNNIIQISATIGLGQVQETENQLFQAAETFQHVLQLVGDFPQPISSEAYLGLARINYQWNDLDAAEQYGQQSANLTGQIGYIDRYVASKNLLARLKLAHGDVLGAAAILVEVDQTIHEHNLLHRIPEVVTNQVLILVIQDKLAAAAELVEKHQLPISQSRVYLAQGEPSSAIAVLESYIPQMKSRGWQDEYLKGIVLQAAALYINGKKEDALQRLGEALTLAKPGGFIRLFVDEGPPMMELLKEAEKRDIAPDYVPHILNAFGEVKAMKSTAHQPVEQLSERELEVLGLLQTELSGPEIASKLMVSLNTLRTHTKNIYAKLGVNNRRSAVRRAGELDLLKYRQP